MPRNESSTTLGAEVRLGVTAAAVHGHPDEGPSVTIGGPGDGATVAADAVVVAVPHDAVADLMPRRSLEQQGAVGRSRSLADRQRAPGLRPPGDDRSVPGRASIRRCSSCSTAPPPPAPRRAHQYAGHLAVGGRRVPVVEARRARGHVHRRDGAPAPRSPARSGRVGDGHPRGRRHVPRRSRNRGAAPPARRRSCPACSWPGRGPTPAGRRRWRGRSAAASPRPPRSAGTSPRGDRRRRSRHERASGRNDFAADPRSGPRTGRAGAAQGDRFARPAPAHPGRVPLRLGRARRHADRRGARGTAGKAVRPALAMLSAPKPWADEAEAAVPGAVALELVHNFSLIHDDLMDGDRTRRHRRTVWAVYGVGDAIIAGDALLTLAVPGAARRGESGSHGGAAEADGSHRGDDRRPGRRTSPSSRRPT